MADQAQRTWIQFLREANKHSCTLEVQADFDGCWEPDLNIDQWIDEANRSRHLFEDPDAFVPTAFWSGMDEPVDHRRQFSITFDMHASDDDLKEAVIAYKRLFWEEQEVMIDRAWKPSPTGKYKLASRPDVPAMLTALAVYQAVKANTGPGKRTLYQLGYELQAKRRSIAEGTKKLPDDAAKQAAVSNAMTKLNSWAKRLIKGVEQGIFPVPK